MQSGAGVRVLNNDVITVTKTGAAAAIGILFSPGTDVLAVGNWITSADNGITFFFATGKYRDNLTSGVTTPFTGGTDAGGNRLFGDSCGSFSPNSVGGEVRQHGGEDLEPQVFLVA